MRPDVDDMDDVLKEIRDARRRSAAERPSYRRRARALLQSSLDWLFGWLRW